MNQNQAIDFANAIRTEAAEAHVTFPQYAGHWAGGEWKLYIVRKTIKTKLGTAFVKGEVVLAKEETDERLGHRLVAYSRSNAIDTILNPKDAAVYVPS